MTSIETIFSFNRAETQIDTDSLVINSEHSAKTVQIAVELGYEGDALLCL
jgi:hypothetical protein